MAVVAVLAGRGLVAVGAVVGVVVAAVAAVAVVMVQQYYYQYSSNAILR